MKILDNGIWVGYDVPHGEDQLLAKGLADFFEKVKGRSILDLGCGRGFYMRYLKARGFLCDGVDGNPDSKVFDEDILVADLSKDQDFDIYDWTLSLEVAEHIPARFMNSFLHNVDKHNTKGVVISWSIPEYGGDGHVNSLSNSRVKEIFSHMGYINDLVSENKLRTCCSAYPEPCYWFSRTLMVFLKEI